MKIGEHSRVTAKFLDPERHLRSLFPAFRECSKCHTMVELESIKDVYHQTYTHDHAAYRKDWLEWTCIICDQRNQFTTEEVLVNAHRRLIRSKYDIAEWIMIGVVILFILFWLWSLYQM